jgi:hypothetical protein
MRASTPRDAASHPCAPLRWAELRWRTILRRAARRLAALARRANSRAPVRGGAEAACGGLAERFVGGLRLPVLN